MVNPVKEKLRQGEPAFGAAFGFTCAPLVEMVGLLGYDFAYLDAEHGTIDPGECADLVRASDARSLPAIVRVGTDDPQVMLRYLDTGIGGIQLPHMRRREDAERAVDAVRFHPHGTRGLAAGRWSDYGLGESLAQSVERANDEVLLIAQIEDTEALDRLEEIASVDGVDVWFVGPADLSQALGVTGQLDHPLVKETVATTIKRLRAMGKIVGSAARTASQANWFLELGVQYFTVSAVRMFAAGAQEFQRGIETPAGNQAANENDRSA